MRCAAWRAIGAPRFPSGLSRCLVSSCRIGGLVRSDERFHRNVYHINTVSDNVRRWAQVAIFFRYSTTVDLDGATHICAIPHAHRGSPAFCALERVHAAQEEGTTIASDEAPRVQFSYQQRVFILDPETTQFRKLPYPVAESISFYKSSRGLGSAIGARSSPIAQLKSCDHPHDIFSVHAMRLMWQA